MPRPLFPVPPPMVETPKSKKSWWKNKGDDRLVDVDVSVGRWRVSVVILEPSDHRLGLASSVAVQLQRVALAYSYARRKCADHRQRAYTYRIADKLAYSRCSENSV